MMCRTREAYIWGRSQVHQISGQVAGLRHRWGLELRVIAHQDSMKASDGVGSHWGQAAICLGGQLYHAPDAIIYEASSSCCDWDGGTFHLKRQTAISELAQFSPPRIGYSASNSCQRMQDKR